MSSELLIQAPRSGIAPSAHTGVADIRQLDIFSDPGVVKLNNLMQDVSGGVVTGLIKWMVKNPATPTEIYAVDDGGVVYKSDDSGDSWAELTGNTAGGHGNGMAIFKNYLFVAGDDFIDVCGDGTVTGITAANWTLDWETGDLVSDVDWHPMLISKNDNKLYIGAGKYVASLDEETTFASGTPATYTWTPQALDLPSNYRIKCLEELGNNLMCGTWQGTNVYDLRIADIFPWDRSSPSFFQPIQIAEHGVHAMLNNGNYLIVLAGIEGRVYKCDGVNASPIVQIPPTISDLSGGKGLLAYPGALINYKGRPFFGIGAMESLEGGELVTNGTFTGGIAGWTPQPTNLGWTYDGVGAALFTDNGGNDAIMEQSIGAENGKIYHVTFSVTQLGASVNGYIQIGAGDFYYFSDSGAQSLNVLAGSSNDQIWFGGEVGTPSFSIDNVSILEISHIPGIGIYSLMSTSKGTILVNEHTISTGNSGDAIIANVASLLAVTRDSLVAGWRSNLDYGIDKIDTTEYASDYDGYFITPLYAVGTNKQPRPFLEIEFQLVKPFRADEGIKIYYRNDLDSGFATLGTWDYDTWGAEISHNSNFNSSINIPPCENLQLKVALKGNATTPELRAVILR